MRYVTGIQHQPHQCDQLRTCPEKVEGKYCSIMMPALHCRHILQLLHIYSVEWFLYFESEVSPNEIFKHLKSLKTNLPNALQFLIKSFVCSYIAVISRFHDALCNFLLSASLCLCVTFWMFTQPKMVSHYIRMYMQVRVCVWVLKKTRWWEMMLLANVQNAGLASLSFVGR